MTLAHTPNRIIFMSDSPMGKAIIKVGVHPKLIANAGELLAILKSTVEFMESLPFNLQNIEMLRMAKTVIAKIEGK